jgi:hypothetical protein
MIRNRDDNAKVAATGLGNIALWRPIPLPLCMLTE